MALWNGIMGALGISPLRRIECMNIDIVTIQWQMSREYVSLCTLVVE